MSDEVNFFDLTALLKIRPDTTMEKFGGMLNSSYFDGANIAATLSQKKLINFNTSMPGQSMITLTDEGKQLIEEANSKTQSEFDHLDFAILVQISNGKKTPSEIGSAVNVRSKDLALHLYKLSIQDFVSYEFRSGNVFIMLTEKGFSQVKTGMPKKNAQAQDASNAAASEKTSMQQAENQEVIAQWQNTGKPNATESSSFNSSYNTQDASINADAQSAQADPQASSSAMSADEVSAKIKSSKRARKTGIILLVLIIILIIAIIIRYIA